MNNAPRNCLSVGLSACLVLWSADFSESAHAAAPLADGVTEEHVLIPMRDGVRLSAYLYKPAGAGPWPVLYQQRYADIAGASTRKLHSQMAARGYVVCVESFRGSQKSEGLFDGYRALGWGERQDGYAQNFPDATLYHLPGVPADTVLHDAIGRPHPLVISRPINGVLV